MASPALRPGERIRLIGENHRGFRASAMYRAVPVKENSLAEVKEVRSTTSGHTEVIVLRYIKARKRFEQTAVVASIDEGRVVMDQRYYSDEGKRWERVTTDPDLEMKVGARIQSIGIVDWVGYTGFPGPKCAKGRIIAMPQTEREKRTNAIPYSMIVKWDHLDPGTGWMPRDYFEVIKENPVTSSVDKGKNKA